MRAYFTDIPKKGISMIILKITGFCTLGFGTLVALLSSAFGPDLVLGIFAVLL